MQLLTFFVFIEVLIVNFDDYLSIDSTGSLCVATENGSEWLRIQRRNGPCTSQLLPFFVFAACSPIEAARSIVIIVILEVERVYKGDYEGTLPICFKLDDPSQAEFLLLCRIHNLPCNR